MRPPLQWSFRAPSISAIITARPRYRSHSQNTLLNDQIRSMIVVTSKISKSDRLENIRSRQLALLSKISKSDHIHLLKHDSWHDVVNINNTHCSASLPVALALYPHHQLASATLGSHSTSIIIHHHCRRRWRRTSAMTLVVISDEYFLLHQTQHDNPPTPSTPPTTATLCRRY